CFFFSSRRRHTRSLRDWSSDVCSSDLMIDTLCWALPQAVARDAPTRLGVGGRPYAVVTLHRPANVDDPAVLGELLDALTRLAERSEERRVGKEGSSRGARRRGRGEDRE